MTFPAELERLKKAMERGDIRVSECAEFFRNHADAILGLVRAAESAHQTLADEGVHAKALRLGQALAKLNGEGK